MRHPEREREDASHFCYYFKHLHTGERVLDGYERVRCVWMMWKEACLKSSLSGSYLGFNLNANRFFWKACRVLSACS